MLRTLVRQSRKICDSSDRISQQAEEGLPYYFPFRGTFYYFRQKSYWNAARFHRDSETNFHCNLDLNILRRRISDALRVRESLLRGQK